MKTDEATSRGRRPVVLNRELLERLEQLSDEIMAEVERQEEAERR